MNLSSFPAPHIRAAQTTRGVMWDAIIALSFLYVISIYYYGLRALALGVFSVLVCTVLDGLTTLMVGKRPNFRDFSATVTGLILPMMMPASISYYIVAIAGAFAILVAKAPFGGVGQNVFNPAAAGFSFVIFTFGGTLFVYPPIELNLPVWGALPEFTAPISPAFVMMVGGTPGHDVFDMILGRFPGPMGATNILVLIACLLYLVFRGAVRWSAPLSFFATVALLAYLFPRGASAGLASVGFELVTGLLLFGGIFLMGDPVTTPKRESAKIAFGVCLGVVVMLFRHFGHMEEQITYALLLLNAAVWGFDMAGEKLAGKIRRKRFATRTGKDQAVSKKA